MGKRGLEFEEFARHEFTSAVSNSIHLRGFAQVWPTNLIFHDEEIDLVIRVGNVVLVGEAKCSFYPVSAVERVNYASTLNHAAEQVLRKSSLLERYSEDFRSQTGWQLAIPFRILPFILTNQPVGVCQTPESIPVVDTRILERFLREGHLESSVVFDTSGKKHVGSRIHFYETPEEAETAIGDYLRCPPQIHAPLRWLGIVNEPILQLKDDGSPAFVRRFVVTPDLRSAFEEE